MVHLFCYGTSYCNNLQVKILFDLFEFTIRIFYSYITSSFLNIVNENIIFLPMLHVNYHTRRLKKHNLY